MAKSQQHGHRWSTTSRTKTSTVAILGTVAASAPKLHEQVMNGFPYAPLDRLQRTLALTTQEVAALLQIPVRTLARRKVVGRLQPAESDRLVRTSMLFARAVELFEGDRDAARFWFMAPQPALGGRRPIEFARTDVGAREVDRVIGRLEHGVTL